MGPASARAGGSGDSSRTTPERLERLERPRPHHLPISISHFTPDYTLEASLTSSGIIGLACLSRPRCLARCSTCSAPAVVRCCSGGAQERTSRCYRLISTSLLVPRSSLNRQSASASLCCRRARLTHQLRSRFCDAPPARSRHHGLKLMPRRGSHNRSALSSRWRPKSRLARSRHPASQTIPLPTAFRVTPSRAVV